MPWHHVAKLLQTIVTIRYIQISRRGTGEKEWSVQALQEVENNWHAETVPDTDITRHEARHGSDMKRSGTDMTISGFSSFQPSHHYARHIRRAIHCHARVR
jgi:hypothetical protein